MDMFALPFLVASSISLYSKITRKETQGKLSTQFLLNPLAVKQDIAVTILLGCMCVHGCALGCICPSGFVQAITPTFMD